MSDEEKSRAVPTGGDRRVGNRLRRRNPRRVRGRVPVQELDRPANDRIRPGHELLRRQLQRVAELKGRRRRPTCPLRPRPSTR